MILLITAIVGYIIYFVLATYLILHYRHYKQCRQRKELWDKQYKKIEEVIKRGADENKSIEKE